RVHRGDKLRHLGHLHALRDIGADDTATGDQDQREQPEARARPDQGRGDGKAHADDAVPDRALGAFLPREPAQQEDEENRRDDIGGRGETEFHLCGLLQDFWNMASMRRVTRKPPKMLIPAMNIESAAKRMTRYDPDPICISAPRMMIDEIALVTAISGV